MNADGRMFSLSSYCSAKQLILHFKSECILEFRL